MLPSFLTIELLDSLKYVVLHYQLGSQILLLLN
jgi:hypothetical protein